MSNNKKIFKVRPNIEIELTRQDIDDIMVCALEGGINYWCSEVEVVGDYLGEFASDQISRGGSLLLHHAWSSSVWELNREKFLKGVKLCFEQGYSVPVTKDGHIDTFNIDADDADNIVQFAIFGDMAQFL